MNRYCFCSLVVLHALSFGATVNAQWEPAPLELDFKSTELPKNTLWFGAANGEGPNSVFSPDRAWLLVREGGPSRGEELILYCRREGVRYAKVKDFGVGDQAEALALKQPDLPHGTRLDHRYISFLMWSADSKAFLFMMSGHDSGKNLYIPSGWFGIYDLTKRTISFDLSQYAFDLSANNKMIFAKGSKSR